MRETASTCATIGVLVKIEGAKKDPAYTPIEGELPLTSDLFDYLTEDDYWLLPPPLVSSSYVFPEFPLVLPSSPSSPSLASSLSPALWRALPSLPLPPTLSLPASPSALPPLDHVDPSALPQLAKPGRSDAFQDL